MHQAFEQFEGRKIKQNERAETNELRFNRYFYDYQGKQVEIDIYLGKALWGLILGRIYFDSLDMPVQHNDAINIFFVEIKRKLWVKSFVVAPEIKYTWVSDDATYHYDGHIPWQGYSDYSSP